MRDNKDLNCARLAPRFLRQTHEQKHDVNLKLINARSEAIHGDLRRAHQLNTRQLDAA